MFSTCHFWLNKSIKLHSQALELVGIGCLVSWKKISRHGTKRMRDNGNLSAGCEVRMVIPSVASVSIRSAATGNRPSSEGIAIMTSRQALSGASLSRRGGCENLSGRHAERFGTRKFLRRHGAAIIVTVPHPFIPAGGVTATSDFF